MLIKPTELSSKSDTREKEKKNGIKKERWKKRYDSSNSNDSNTRSKDKIKNGRSNKKKLRNKNKKWHVW